MHNRPLIGLAASREADKAQLFVRQNYMQSVLDAGGLPVMLPQNARGEEIEQLLDSIDGLLLTGGVDILPAYYGEETLPACGEIDPQRDGFEIPLTKGALARNMPIFGICRGIQTLNVVMGGTLIQDIPTQCGAGEKDHQQNPPYDVPKHEVIFTEGGFFAKILGKTHVMGNSMHHQCVKDAAPDLVVEGYSPDGIVEALRHATRPDVFAVQYHPEYLSHVDEDAKALFAYFVRCCEKNMNK